jgi:hypothetical protein
MPGVRPEPPAAFGARPRLGALLALLLVWVGATVVASSLLAPAVSALVEWAAPGRFPFQRVLRRVAMLVAVLLLVALRRRIGFGGLAGLGLARSPGRWRAAGAAAGAGAAAIAALFAGERALGTRIDAFDLAPGEVAAALAGAAAIGLVEEALCRGALLFPFGRLTGWRFWVANAATSALYATAHFARGGGRPRTVDWTTGWEIWAEIGPAVGQHLESWTGLAATGALFYALAWRQGHVWGAAGLHAAAVLALQIGGELTDPATGGRSLVLVDGLLPGYPLAALAFAAAVAIWRSGERRGA